MNDPQALDPQRLAADPDLSVFVTANAGSGKTTTLVNRVARLLLQDVDPAAILCVTYTKAAAAEMQARLFGQLGGWAVMDDAELEEKLLELDDRPHPDLSKARRLFARALETPGGLKIQTIHAFCEKLLRRFPLEAGVSPRFTVLEDSAALELSHRAREALARAALRDPEGPIGAAFSHFAIELDWTRFQALLAMMEAERAKLTAYVDAAARGEAPGPHALVGADPDRSAAEVEADFLRFIDREEWRRTAEAMERGSTNDAKLAACMRQALANWTFGGLGPTFLTTAGEARASMGTKSAPPDAVSRLIDLQARYLATRDQLRAARVADDTVRVLTLARAHAALYEEAKRASGALDFGDLVAKTVELLTEKADAAWVLYKLDGGIDHVLIDEAQDTAPEQWAIVRALTEEFFAADPQGRTVFAVGDEKQSIYSFQGARPEQLRQQSQGYQQLVEGAGGRFQQVPLEKSWRSTEAVLAFVDAVFDDPDRRRAVVGPQGDIQRHIPARTGQPGSVDLIPLFIDPEKVEREAWDAPVDQESGESGRKALARRLAETIRDQVEQGVAVHDKRGALRACGYGDFLVLVRRRDALFEEIIRALKLAGVPVAGADRLKLSTHIVFGDLKALARWALYPDDDLSLAEVLRSPLCDVPDFGPADSLYDLAGREDRGGLWRELRERASEQPAWGRAAAFLEAVRDAAREFDPFGFFSFVLNRVDDTGRSGRGRILARLGQEATEALDETLNQVLAAEERGGTDLETCLSLLEASEVEVKRELEGPRAEVRVMTVHGAKGLEAPVVILPDTTVRAKPQGPTLMPVALPDGGEAFLMCPGSGKEDCPASAEARAARDQRTRDESLRLLYVALTRARDRLIVMGRRSAAKGPDEGSWWAVIEETFDRLAASGQVRVLDGDLRRYGEDPPAVERSLRIEPELATAPAWARETPRADPSARFSGAAGLKEARRAPAPSPLSTAAGGMGRFRRGELIHRLLERLPEVPPEARPEVAGRLLARERDLEPAQAEEMIAAAFAVLEDARFAPVFGPGSRAEVALTGSAPGLPAGVTLSGRIDRLVVAPDRVLVVDFKTNRPAPDRVEDADESYILQLAAYRAVLERLYPDRPVEAALVWTDGPRLMPVPGPLMEATLRAAR